MIGELELDKEPTSKKVSLEEAMKLEPQTAQEEIEEKNININDYEEQQDQELFDGTEEVIEWQ